MDRALLRLYPPSFRRRFGREWLEVAAWHRRSLLGRPFGRLRLLLRLVRDTARSLPLAYRDARRARRPHGGGGGWWRDARHAAAALRHNRAFAWGAAASVAFGVGVNTATFSVVDAVLLRPLPYAAPHRLAIVWNEFPGSAMARLPLTGPQVQLLREEPGLFEGVAGIWATSGTLTDREGRPRAIGLGTVTPDFFALLGVEPAIGRAWSESDPGRPAPRGIVLSHELWQAAHGGDPGVLGRTLELDGEPRTVLGVLPEGFTLHLAEDGAIPARLDAYVAIPWDLSVLPPAQHYLRVIARLTPATDWDEAAEGVAAVAERARARYPELRSTGDVFSVHPLQEDAVRTARPVLLTLWASVGLLLLLASANVASLILARTTSRARELAVRRSLGASRRALGRLVVVESLLVTGLGAALGAALGRVGTTVLWALRPAGLSRADHLPIDANVLAFTAGVTVLCGLVFAVVSMVAVRGVPLALAGRSGATAPAGARLRQGLTAAEVALGLVLVTGSALMVQSFSTLGRESVGFDPRGALTFRVSFPLARFPSDADRAEVVAEIERRLRAMPGVRAVGATSHLPFAPWANWAEAAPPAGTAAADRSTWFADLRSTTPGYLEAVGAELLAGRFFRETDAAGSGPVVVVDSTMAARVFPGEDAVGRLLEPSRFTGGEFVVTEARVVGVVRDLRDRSPARPSTGQVFWPFGLSPRWELTWFVRTAGDPRDHVEAVRGAVSAASPDLEAARLAPMSDYVRGATGITRFLALVGTVFSVLAVSLAGIGLYGVVASLTVMRTRELAVRTAVGASRRDVLGNVVAQGLRVGAVGVAVGLAACLALGGSLDRLVYGVSPRDPLTLVAVASFLLGVAVVASLVPAARAVSVDPVQALRDG